MKLKKKQISLYHRPKAWDNLILQIMEVNLTCWDISVEGVDIYHISRVYQVIEDILVRQWVREV